MAWPIRYFASLAADTESKFFLVIGFPFKRNSCCHTSIWWITHTFLLLVLLLLLAFGIHEHTIVSQLFFCPNDHSKLKNLSLHLFSTPGRTCAGTHSSLPCYVARLIEKPQQISFTWKLGSTLLFGYFNAREEDLFLVLTLSPPQTTGDY